MTMCGRSGMSKTLGDRAREGEQRVQQSLTGAGRDSGPVVRRWVTGEEVDAVPALGVGCGGGDVPDRPIGIPHYDRWPRGKRLTDAQLELDKGLAGKKSACQRSGMEAADLGYVGQSRICAVGEGDGLGRE